MAETPTPEFLAFVRQWAAARTGPVRVLEVGGGSKSYLGLADAIFTSIEPTPQSLARSGFAQERLLGDAQVFDYGARRFDAVVFWNVLEHIPRVEDALARALATLKPGGLAVVRGPDLDSLKAVITRCTPHRFHVLFYRRVLGLPGAGRPGHAPFPVEHAADAGIARIEGLLAGAGLRPAFRQIYVGDQLTMLRERHPLAGHAYDLASAILRCATGGRRGGHGTDFVVASIRP